MRGTRWVTLALVLAVLLSACGDPGGGSEDANCIPSTPGSVQSTGDPDRRIEDIIETLTGERQTDDVPVEDKITDPNFGGVWGDFEGGVVVAVLDCSEVDANRIAELAGGADYLHLIEVPYTFKQIETFKDALYQNLQTLDIEGDVSVSSTLTGRQIEVHILDTGVLPGSFGSEVPEDAFEIIESETVGTIEG